MGNEVNVFDVQDKLENYQQDINELESTVHACLEGIRTDSLGKREIINTVAMLYKLAGIMAKRLEGIRETLKTRDNGMYTNERN